MNTQREMRVKYFIGILFLCLIHIRCSQYNNQFDSVQALQVYLYNEENGATVSKEIQELKLSTTFLPPALVIHRLKDIKANLNEQPSMDGIVPMSFLFSIRSSNSQKISLAQHADVSNLNEYKRRVELLNFQMEQFVTLSIGNTTVIPELYLLESNIEDYSKVSFYLVFEADEALLESSDSREIKLSFEDRVFKTGLNHFVFPKEKIIEMSQIGINNKEV